MKNKVVSPIKPKPTFKSLTDAVDAHVGIGSKNKIYFVFGKEAKVQSSRSNFSDTDDLIRYIKTLFPLPDGTGQGLQMTIRCKGKYQKVNKKGSPVVTYGDPILDLITSDEGKVIIEGVTYDFEKKSNKRSLTENINTRETKKFIDEDTGQSITFHAYKSSYLGVGWKIGVEITIIGEPFERSQINSQYGESVSQGICAVVRTDDDDDINDKYLNEYEWGIKASEPNEVRAICSAIWKNQEITAFVQCGSGCDSWLSDPPILKPFSEWKANVKIPNLKSKATPAIVEFKNRLHMVFIGETSNDMYHWMFDGNKWNPTIGGNGKIPGQKSKTTPALAVYNNQIHMVHLGDSSNDIWYSTFNGDQWTENVKSEQKSKGVPALGVYNNALHMVHVGSESNNLYHRVLNVNQWAPLGSNNGIIPNQKSKVGPALSGVSGRLFMIHLGDSSNEIWFSQFDGNKWSTNVRIGQESSVTPAILGRKLVHSANGSTSIWESDFLDPNWSLNKKIPGQATKNTPALARLNGRLFMIHLGESSNNLWISEYGYEL